MRNVSRELFLAFGLALVFSDSARAQLCEGSVCDVGPEAGIVFGSQPFLFRGSREILVTSGRAGLYKSYDAGKHWERREPGLVAPSGVEPHAASLCQANSAPEIVYAATLENGLFRTADFGETWVPLAPLINPSLLDCAVDPSDPDVVYALVGSVDPLHPALLYKSTDGGQSFRTVAAGLPDLAILGSLAIAPTNPRTVYVVGFGLSATTLYVSSDGGLNFRPLPNTPPSASSVFLHPTEDGVLLVATANLMGASSSARAMVEIRSPRSVSGWLPPRFLRWPLILTSLRSSTYQPGMLDSSSPWMADSRFNASMA